MEHFVFYIVTDYRGSHWKGITIYNANLVHLKEFFVLINKNVNFEHFLKSSELDHLY